MPRAGGESLYIRGHAYVFHRDRDYRTEGLQAMREGLTLLRFGKRPEAQQQLRRALQDLVYAFLSDRGANARLFSVAHNVGRIVEKEFGCPLEYDAASDCYFSECPIDGLHSRVGMSAAFTTATQCSICGADDFECDHVPGRVYDGRLCFRGNRRVVTVREVSMTPDPDHPETFVQHVGRPRSELEQVMGRPIKPGESVVNRHCETCLGAPTEADLNPDMWDKSWMNEGGSAQ